MLDALDLSLELGKAEYKQLIPELQRQLLLLQRASWEADLATIIVFEGWSGSDKGGAIGKLTQRLEPRGFSLHATRAPRTTQSHLPWMWRFWVDIPNWGEISIFDRSWYRRVVVERVEGDINEQVWTEAYNDIVSFERTLTEDRYLIVKFFLHISKDEQQYRLEKAGSDPHTAWRVEERDREQHAKYDEYLVVIEEMLERTETEWGPWSLIAATDKRWTRFRMFDTLVKSMTERLVRLGIEPPKFERSEIEIAAPTVSQTEDSED